MPVRRARIRAQSQGVGSRGGHPGGGQAQGAGRIGLVLALQGAEDGGAGEEEGGVGAVGLGQLPVAGPGEAAAPFGEDDEAVAAAVPVVAGAGEELPGLTPAPPRARASRTVASSVSSRTGSKVGPPLYRGRPKGGGGRHRRAPSTACVPSGRHSPASVNRYSPSRTANR
ncbi:hypothetical protein GCM10020000_64230 [Streptomyces olivoverticillatus]